MISNVEFLVKGYLLLALPLGVFSWRMHYLAKQRAAEIRNDPFFGTDRSLQREHVISLDRAQGAKRSAVLFLGAAAIVVVAALIA